MASEVQSRDEVANNVHHAIIALQDALTHLWAAVLALEVVDVAPGGDRKRLEALEAMKASYLRWQEAQSSLDTAFQAWTAVVGAQQHEVEMAREWLRAICFTSPDSLPGITLVTDHAVAQQILDAFDREACDHARRLIGLSPLEPEMACNCLIECPAVQLCPLFHQQ